jgi:hypothetical protein
VLTRKAVEALLQPHYTPSFFLFVGKEKFTFTKPAKSKKKLKSKAIPATGRGGL